MRAEFALFRTLFRGEIAAHPARSLIAIVAIAVGVALGFAVEIVNRSALSEFAHAVRATTGMADVVIRGTGLAVRRGFDDHAFESMLLLPEVAAASPVVELDTSVANASARARETLPVIGIDPLRARDTNPRQIGRSGHVDRDARDGGGTHDGIDRFDPRAIWLSAAAMTALDVRDGDELVLQSGADIVAFVVAGSVEGAAPRERLGVIDIASAQSRFHRDGILTRIDVVLAQGVSPTQLRAAMAAAPALRGLAAVEPNEQESRAASLSRAYRVNLDVLALVALFTGGYLVYSVQVLSVARRRAAFGLLRVLGLSRARLVRHVVAEGALFGVVGSAGGIAGGGVLAAALLRFVGGDLGGGFFAESTPSLEWSWVASAVYAGAGLAAAIIGSLMPALEAARTPPARALKAGAVAARVFVPHRFAWSLAAMVAGAGLAFAPPIAGVPVAGYLAIAMMIVGGIGLLPSLVHRFSAVAMRRFGRSRFPIVVLAAARVAHVPGETGVVLAGVLASFSLMTAMAIMVASFRVSVDDWLATVLPADLYVRAAANADLGTATRDAIAHAEGVGRAEFARFARLSLDPSRPDVVLVARELGDGSAATLMRRIPLTAPPRIVDGLPIYVSEAMVDLYDYAPGRAISLPIAGRPDGAPVTATVAGVWRDYARQFGAIVVDRQAYRRATGDDAVTDVALWLAHDARPEATMAALRALPSSPPLEIASATAMRIRALAVFDRSFAVTYLLEAVAMGIGLIGIAAAFGAQTLARIKEFGMLRHLGVSRREIVWLLAAEGLILTLIGTLAGLALGFAVALVLIHVVNPQSFHWTMDLHLPVALLASIALALLACAALTARVAGRAAAASPALLAVREDW